MRIKLQRHSVAYLALGFGLVACAPMQVAVKDAATDKFAYLGKNFGINSVNRSVTAAIAGVDKGVMNFKKAVFTFKPEQELSSSSGPKPEYLSVSTYLNLGGPFVQELDELSSNGLAASQTYSLSYRGMRDLRYQSMRLANSLSGVMIETKAIKQFESEMSGQSNSGRLLIEELAGTNVQIINFKTEKFTCRFGDVFLADSLSPKLSGKAQNLDCESINDNGVTTVRSKKVLLLDLGIAIPVRNEGTNYVTNFKIVDVDIQT